MSTPRASVRAPSRVRGSTARTAQRASGASPPLRRSPRHNPPPPPAPDVPISGPPPGEQQQQPDALPEPSAAARERAEREAHRRLLRSVQADPDSSEDGREPWYSVRRTCWLLRVAIRKADCPCRAAVQPHPTRVHRCSAPSAPNTGNTGRRRYIGRPCVFNARK